MGRLVALWQQVCPRRRLAGGLLTVAWVWAVGGEWLCDRLGWVWWPGWGAIVVLGVAYAVIQARRVCAWWRRQDDLAARAAAIQQARARAAGSTPTGTIYIGRVVGRAAHRRETV